MEVNVCDNVYNCDKNCVIKYLDAIRNHYCALRNKFIVAENELNVIKIENINLKETIKCYESKDNIPKLKSSSKSPNLAPVINAVQNNCKENDLLKTPPSIKKSNTCRTPLTPNNNISNNNNINNDTKNKKLHIIKLFHDDVQDLTNAKEEIGSLGKAIKKIEFISPKNKNKLKQSKIDDKYLIKSNKSNKNNTIDTDETFCEELITASPTSLVKKNQQKSCLRLRPKKTKATFDDDNNDKMMTKKIKEEPVSEIIDTHLSIKSCDDIEMKTLEPNVILIEDTENFNTDSNTNDLFKQNENNTNLLNLLEANCLKNLEPDDSNELTFNDTSKLIHDAYILCKDCERKRDYYKYIDELTDNKIKQLENECFKHRPKHYTPENFWKPYFTPTQD